VEWQMWVALLFWWTCGFTTGAAIFYRKKPPL
jgi:hypothetical protein